MHLKDEISRMYVIVSFCFNSLGVFEKSFARKTRSYSKVNRSRGLFEFALYLLAIDCPPWIKTSSTQYAKHLLSHYRKRVVMQKTNVDITDLYMNGHNKS